MNTLGAFLAAAVGPLAKRVLTALGFGVVSFAAVQAAIGGLLNQAQSAWGGLAGDTAAYLALGGYNTALSILGGALTARVALMVLKRLQVL